MITPILDYKTNNNNKNGGGTYFHSEISLTFRGPDSLERSPARRRTDKHAPPREQTLASSKQQTKQTEQVLANTIKP